MSGISPGGDNDWAWTSLSFPLNRVPEVRNSPDEIDRLKHFRQGQDCACGEAWPCLWTDFTNILNDSER